MQLFLMSGFLLSKPTERRRNSTFQAPRMGQVDIPVHSGNRCFVADAFKLMSQMDLSSTYVEINPKIFSLHFCPRLEGKRNR
ncbi:hypothetical protein [Xanthomonas oryzae]|uniref:hypothetical protein n=1 Tax=Xanthomonas oryzae TaxID=347 RepID=UPI001033DCDA|nr:hypothetical protein [Xanthomonas oryzae]QBH00133.1 hypothetical protein EYC56_13510 [Xanthomonas oryzae]